MIRNVNEKCEIYKEGTEIYYTGDAANVPAYGVITKVIEPSEYSGGWKYEIEMKDGRIFKMVYALLFGTKPGDRFKTKEEHENEKLKYLIDMIKKTKTETLEKYVNNEEETQQTRNLIRQELESRKSALSLPA